METFSVQAEDVLLMCRARQICSQVPFIGHVVRQRGLWRSGHHPRHAALLPGTQHRGHICNAVPQAGCAGERLREAVWNAVLLACGVLGSARYLAQPRSTPRLQ